jgi:K+-dependent Na+/Ca+ exchanger-like protein
MDLMIYIFVCVFVLIVMVVISEEFFIPSIDLFSKKLNLSSDAAGATLLAMGSSAPEFFTSLIAILGLGGAHADVGAGTIVGSAIFNILVIVGASALFRAVKVQWQPVMRDMMFYIVTILLLMWAFWDGKIVILEAIIFLVTYVLYVILASNWRKILPYHDQQAEEVAERKKSTITKSIHLGLSQFVPNVEKKPHLYWVTFFISIAVIAITSFVLVWSVEGMANILNLNPTFLALTLIAAGTSMPDLIGSIVVARQGRGDMAVGNAVGSNIFDILFGLGLPWFIALSLNGWSSNIGVGRENLLSSIFLLFATVVALLFIMIFRNWKIGQKSGWVLIAMYVGYCVYIVLSLN